MSARTPATDLSSAVVEERTVPPAWPSLRSDKITARPLERLARVYLRQSTPQQLIRPQESKEVPYQLRFRAAQLGWPRARVEVIDDDLGKSGTSVQGPPGFQRLVTEVSRDHVGLIFGAERSRRARSCRDWYQLLDVCAVFGTLIADLEGVYDPSQDNDRRLLGLKGTRSEAELHILKQRLLQGKRNNARKGALRFSLPIGYVRRAHAQVGLDADEQGPGVVRLIFATYQELGPLKATLQYLVGPHLRLGVRLRGGERKGELAWHRPNRVTRPNLLTQPI